MANSVSPQGVAFTGNNEGFVSKFYKDAGGVGTIGSGFTALSKTFNDYWMKTRGHKLRAGDTITKEESLQVLAAIIAEEYAPPVAKKYGDALPQNEFDAVTDAVYNCGAGTLKDKWAVALATNLATAASLLLTTRITAGGKVLAGLKSRRSKEVNLLVKGDYAGAVVPDEAPAQAAADKRAADAAVAKTVAKTTAPASTAAGAATHVTVTAKTIAAPATAVSLHTLYVAAAFGLGALALVGIGYLVYRNRGVILRKRTPA